MKEDNITGYYSDNSIEGSVFNSSVYGTTSGTSVSGGSSVNTASGGDYYDSVSGGIGGEDNIAGVVEGSIVDDSASQSTFVSTAGDTEESNDNNILFSYSMAKIDDINLAMTNFAEQAGLDVNDLRVAIGQRSSLNTSAKDTIVSAINETLATAQAVQTNLGAYATKTSVESDINSAKTEVLNAIIGDASLADEAKNSLSELITYFNGLDGDQQGLIDQLVNAKTVRYDEAQTLTDEEKVIARTNIGAIDSVEAGTIADDKATAKVNEIVGTAPISNFLALYNAKVTAPAV